MVKLHVVSRICYYIISIEYRPLVDSLAVLIAITLGWPPHYSHLYTHLIRPDKLDKAYIPGYMVSINKTL